MQEMWPLIQNILLCDVYILGNLLDISQMSPFSECVTLLLMGPTVVLFGLKMKTNINMILQA